MNMFALQSSDSQGMGRQLMRRPRMFMNRHTRKEAPTNVKYAVHKGKRDLVQNVTDFSQSVGDTRTKQQQERENKRNQQRTNLAQKRQEMDKAKQGTDTSQTKGSPARPPQDFTKSRQSVNHGTAKNPTVSKSPEITKNRSVKETTASPEVSKATRTYHHERPTPAVNRPLKETPATTPKEGKQAQTKTRTGTIKKEKAKGGNRKK